MLWSSLLLRCTLAAIFMRIVVGPLKRAPSKVKRLGMCKRNVFTIVSIVSLSISEENAKAKCLKAHRMYRIQTTKRAVCSFSQNHSSLWQEYFGIRAGCDDELRWNGFELWMRMRVSEIFFWCISDLFSPSLLHESACPLVIFILCMWNWASNEPEKKKIGLVCLVNSPWLQSAAARNSLFNNNN